MDEPEEEEIPDQVGEDEPAGTPDTPVVIPDDPVVIPAEEPEAPAALDDVPDIPGSLFEEPTLF